MIPMPRMLWQKRLFKRAEKIEKEHGFMSEEHRNVRNFVLRELPRVGEPLSPKFIAQRLSLQAERVEVILDELEKHMAYLFRSKEGAVVWAYPVTVEPTPHHLTFSSGEQVYAA